MRPVGVAHVVDQALHLVRREAFQLLQILLVQQLTQLVHLFWREWLSPRHQRQIRRQVEFQFGGEHKFLSRRNFPGANQFRHGERGRFGFVIFLDFQGRQGLVGLGGQLVVGQVRAVGLPGVVLGRAGFARFRVFFGGRGQCCQPDAGALGAHFTVQARQRARLLRPLAGFGARRAGFTRAPGFGSGFAGPGRVRG